MANVVAFNTDFNEVAEQIGEDAPMVVAIIKEIPYECRGYVTSTPDGAVSATVIGGTGELPDDAEIKRGDRIISDGYEYRVNTVGTTSNVFWNCECSGAVLEDTRPKPNVLFELSDRSVQISTQEQGRLAFRYQELPNRAFSSIRVEEGRVATVHNLRPNKEYLFIAWVLSPKSVRSPAVTQRITTGA